MDATGKLQEKVYDVAWSDDRKPGADGKLPPVGNTVDVANATWTNTIGSPELIAVWKDPDFDPKLRAVYYARVIEIPTPRWTAYDQKRFGIKMAGQRADDGAGACLHIADLVYAVGHVRGIQLDVDKEFEERSMSLHLFTTALATSFCAQARRRPERRQSRGDHGGERRGGDQAAVLALCRAQLSRRGRCSATPICTPRCRSMRAR